MSAPERMSEEKLALDHQWYTRYEALAAKQAYELLGGNKEWRERQKADFLAGKIDNPSLDYPDINPQELVEKIDQLLALKEEILANERNDTVRACYQWRINEKIAEFRMLLATHQGDTRRFRRYTEFVYGRPDKNVFNYTLGKLEQQIANALTSEDPNLQLAATELQALLPKAEPYTPPISIPTTDIVDHTRIKTLETLNPDLARVLRLVDKQTQEKFGAAEIKSIFDEVLQAMRIDGWEVVIDNGSKTGISVDQGDKKVKIPQAREVSKTHLMGLIAHELGTHVARRKNGERSKLMLLGLGLDRYERGEEGVTTIREQVIEDKVGEFAGLQGHLAISLAYGLDGKARDFREVYEILEKYYRFKNALEGKKTDNTCINNAWNWAIRTFRGTNCHTKGVCNTKDIIYREGNIGVWESINKNPNEMMRWDVGKYDPSNPRHLLVLDRLGISDADLKALDA